MITGKLDRRRAELGGQCHGRLVGERPFEVVAGTATMICVEAACSAWLSGR